MKKLLTVFTALFMMSSLSAQIDFEHSSWNEVLAKAKKENKIIFVDGYATWCGPCKWMAKNVFTDKNVGDFYNKTFINVKLDLEKGEGLTFAKKYGIKGYPTLYFINGNGDLVHQYLGGMDKNNFLQLGKNAIDPKKQIFTLKETYDSGKASDEDVMNYIQALKASGNGVDEKVLIGYLKGKDMKAKENMEFLLKYVNPSLESNIFKEFLKIKEEYIAVFGATKINNFISSAANNDIRKSDINPSDKKALNAHYAKYFDEAKASLHADQTYLGMLMYSKKPDDKARFLAEAESIMKNEPDFNSNFYNSVAWEYHLATDNNDKLEKALKWADISVKKEPNAYNLDTKASILYKLKRKEEALKLANQAMKLGTLMGMDMSSTKKLIEKINKL